MTNISDEDAERHQRGLLLGEPDSAIRSCRRASCSALDIQRAGDQGMNGNRLTLQFAHDGAVVEHQHPVAAADQFVIVGRIEQDRRARIRQPAQQLVELLLRADVDAARRVVEQDECAAGASAIWQSRLSAGFRRRATPTGISSPAVLMPASLTISSISRSSAARSMMPLLAKPGRARQRRDFPAPSWAASGLRSCDPRE